jgi:hypothetical protein
VNDGLAANVRCADEVRAQKEMARGALAELEAEWAVRLERLRLEAKALEQQREETHDKLQVGATRRVASHLARLHRACRTAYGVCCMLHLTVAWGPTATSRRCVALRCVAVRLHLGCAKLWSTATYCSTGLDSLAPPCPLRRPVVTAGGAAADVAPAQGAGGAARDRCRLLASR